MKKIMSAILAAMLLAVLGCAAALAEDSLPQPEGGKKFESDWALMGGLVNITYEEEGYRVLVDLCNGEEGTGTVWEYSCDYDEDRDALVSVASSKTAYTFDPDTLDRTYGEQAYGDFDEEGQQTVFTIGENGMLYWEDGRGNDGTDLEFRDIGRYEGVWRNEAEEVEVRFTWEGLTDQEAFYYSATIHRGTEAFFVEFNMQGLPDFETGRMELVGTAVTYTLNAEGGYDAETDGEEYDAFFSEMDDGRILFETANGIELTYDLLGEFMETSQG